MILSIQYLRAFAVIGVLAAHTRGGYFLGAQGVDLFFVISGYIMMYITATKERTVIKFVLSRFLRIAPLYYLFTILIILLGFSNDPTPLHIFLSAIFLKTPIYTSPVLSVGWTLEYEFIFYMMVAFSLIFIKKELGIFLITSLLIFIAFIGIDIVLYPQKMYGHFLEFWYGMVIFLILKNYKFENLNKISLFSLFVFGFIWYSFTPYMLDDSGKTFLRFITYGIPSAIIFFSVLLFERKFGIFNNKFLLLIGNASFSIYVSHTISLHLFYDLFNITRRESFLGDMSSLLFALVIGLLIYQFIEKHIIKYTHSKILRKL
jgi:exopolysaccharide production protein ExoZ